MKKLVLILFILINKIIFAGGAAPVNDNPCAATPIAVGATCVYTPTTNNNATNTAGVPAPGCANYLGGDVWFKFTAPAGGTVIINTNTNILTDGGMAIYSGACGALALVECDDDDSENGLMPKIQRSGLTPGITYYVRFWEYGNDNQGTFSICITIPPPPPPNDNCPGAIIASVNVGSTCTSITSGTIESATTSAQANGCGGTADDDVWYRFQATSTTQNISLNNITGSTSDLYHSVYGGTCAAPGAALVCSDPNSSSISGLTIGSWYYVRIFSWTATTGQNSDFDLCITTPPPPPANQNCDDAIQFCSSAGATMNGVTGYTAEAGNNYGCLSSQPNPYWYFFTMSSNGSINIDLAAPSDVDFALWGPYNTVAAAINDCGSLVAPIDCSFSISTTESIDVAAGNIGKTYILLVTNYANVNQALTLTFDNPNSSGDCDCISLPIELLSFTVNNINSKNILNWITITELNNDYFVLENSIDGYNWNEIAKVDGNHTNFSGNIYEYIHVNYRKSINYYRLKQVDINGAYEYLKTIYIDNTIDYTKIIKYFNYLGQEVSYDYPYTYIALFKDGTLQKINK